MNAPQLQNLASIDKDVFLCERDMAWCLLIRDSESNHVTDECATQKYVSQNTDHLFSL